MNSCNLNDCTKNSEGKCTIYEDCRWVERRGGCPINHKYEVVTAQEKKRVGQQRGKRGKKEDTFSYKRGRKARREKAHG